MTQVKRFNKALVMQPAQNASTASIRICMILANKIISIIDIQINIYFGVTGSRQERKLGCCLYTLYMQVKQIQNGAHPLVDEVMALCFSAYS